MGALNLTSKRKDEKIFLAGPRLIYVSPQGVNKPQPDPTVPQAYLKYIHYDQDSQFVSMGYLPISGEANESYQQLFLQMVAQEDGFVQFFVANETLRDVYFDDITGMVRRPKIIQEAHYNPFGLPLAGLTTLGNPEYAYFFTGKELYEDEALQWYDYGARMYDVQIGRWTTHDPLYQDASPYIFCGNNAINKVDLDGRWSEGNVGPGYYPDPNPQFWKYGGATYYRPNGLSAWTDIGNLNHRQSLQFNDPKFKEAEWTRAQYDLSYSRLSGIDYYSAKDNLPVFSFGSVKDMYKQMSQSKDFHSAIADFADKRKAPGWRETFDNTELKAILGKGGVGQGMVKIGGEWDTKYTIDVLSRLEAQTQGSGPVVLQAGFGGNEHLIGPALVLAGSRIKTLKPIAALGSKPGSSVASHVLRNVPGTLTGTLGNRTGSLVARISGTNMIGGTLGRAVPWVGLGFMAYDFFVNIALPMGEINEEYNKQKRETGDWIATLPH